MSPTEPQQAGTTVGFCTRNTMCNAGLHRTVKNKVYFLHKLNTYQGCCIIGLPAGK